MIRYIFIFSLVMILYVGFVIFFMFIKICNIFVIVSLVFLVSNYEGYVLMIVDKVFINFINIVVVGLFLTFIMIQNILIIPLSHNLIIIIACCRRNCFRHNHIHRNRHIISISFSRSLYLYNNYFV